MISSLLRPLPALLFLPPAAHGNFVTTITDEDNGSLGGGTGISLREAVNHSPPGSIITFAAALSGRTIRLTLGEIIIAKSLTIDGSALPASVTLSGDKTGNGKSFDDTRIIHIASGTVVLDSLILDRGYWTTGTSRYGGAIHVNNSVTHLTVRNSTISNNESTTYGGGIYFMGASNNPNSSLKIQKCNFTGNDTGHDGGAIHMSGTLRVEDSTFSNNIAFQGCAIFNKAGAATVENSTFTGGAAYGDGGAIYNYGVLVLRRSTLSGNSADRGGGIYSTNGSLTVEASTLTANVAKSKGGGIHSASGALTLLHATLTGNSATVSGGGIHRVTDAAFELRNSIVAGNAAPAFPNIEGTHTGTYNLTSGAPLLAPLGDYGGLTKTMPPLPGSPAINAGGATTLTTDQRGLARVSSPDIGAAEYQGAADLVRFWKLDFDGDGSPFGVEQALGTDPLVSDPANPGNPSAPVLGGAGQATLDFGLQPAAATGTRWVLRRSPDLSSGSFVEIYRYDGSSDIAAPGISYVRTSSSITVTDLSPLPGSGFYRFEALLEP